MNKKSVTLFVLISITLAVIVFLFDKKGENLNNKLEEKSRLLSVYIPDGSGGYTKLGENEWPDYRFRYDYSVCENGTDITWDRVSRRVYIDPKNSGSCEIYFKRYSYVGESKLYSLYAPNGTTINGIEVYAVKFAELDTSNGMCSWKLLPKFENVGIDVDILNSENFPMAPYCGDVDYTSANAVLPSMADFHSQNVSFFATLMPYIVANKSSLCAEHCQESHTTNVPIGTENISTDGVALFSGLIDGLYVVYSNTELTVGSTTYTPVPVVVAMPYTYNGYLTNNIIFNFAFTTSSSGGGPGPEVPDVPGPTPGGDPNLEPEPGVPEELPF